MERGTRLFVGFLLFLVIGMHPLLLPSESQVLVLLWAASDLPRISIDPVRKEGLDREALGRIAGEIARTGKIDFLEIGKGRFVSPADQLAALVEFLGKGFQQGENPDRVEVLEVLGPSEVPPETEVSEAPPLGFFQTVLDVRDALRSRRQVPSPVFLGSRKVAPADFLVACAALTRSLLEPGAPGERAFQKPVAIPRGTPVLTERRAAEHTPDLFGGWVIHPEGFRAPRIVRLTKLQAWTLKPAGAARVLE